MKNFSKLLVASAVAFVACPVFGAAPELTQPVPTREHRAIWMTPYLSSNWPSAAVTPANAATQKKILQQRMDRFKAQNINIIYYHARANCDATYKSSLEPWSSTVGGTRGNEPAFDVFAFLLEEAHARGIEVYAWVNPYRYADGTSKTPYGGNELNYENSHPEWLLINSKQSVLNPALEPVKQRVLDVITEIVTNYDVDGVVFDDYFYGQGGTAMTADAEQYSQYTKGGGKLSQADWRRWHVNDMVHRVNAAIKAVKPWMPFGIAPAGVSSPTNITTEYGLPAISGDWQYNQIYSDPLAWLKGGDIDFISPQIYWPNRFDELCKWWNNAALKFNRHFYASVDISDIKTYKQGEFIREIDMSRSVQPAGTAGMVFFQYADFINAYENVYDKSRPFCENLSIGPYVTKALTPLRPWNNNPAPCMTSNVTISNGMLTWTEVPGMRYTVYAFPKSPDAQFAGGVEYLHGISYTNSYELPADADAYDWYVAVYDRYGNEYSPLGVGATPGTATAPVLTYPANGEQAVDLFRFQWTTAQPGMSTVEVAEDSNFDNVVGTVVTAEKSLSVTALPPLETGKTYYWRVRQVPVNALEAQSAAQSFTVSRIALTSPEHASTGHGLTPTIQWTKAAEGTEYTLEISHLETFAQITHSAVTTQTSAAVPERTLMTGRTYYARVTAANDGATSVSSPIKFTTANRTDYPVPTLVNPAQDGVTLHSDDCISVAPWDGMYQVNINISATNTFPARTTYAGTLNNFESNDKTLGEVKIVSKNLEDGTTYFVRARGSYYVDGAVKYTDYTPVVSFVYSQDAGVDDIEADSTADAYIDGNGTLHATAGLTVNVYTAGGALVATIVTDANGNATLTQLPAGAYIVKAGNDTLKLLR